MIYQLLINHKLFKFIQIGNRTALVVRSADAVELGAFGRVQGAPWLCLPPSRLGHSSRLDGSRLGVGFSVSRCREPPCSQI